MIDLPQKEALLRSIFADMGSCLVALSGGVDSAYLALVAHQELGDRALAVTAESPSYPENQRKQTLRLVEQFSFRHEFVQSEELLDENYARNPVNRCYFCKSELYGKLKSMAGRWGFRFVADGNNTDDTGDYRPGRLAGSEMGVRSPLIEAGINKAEVRTLSRIAGLPTWDLPASACLSSRIPYGLAVTVEKLKMIDQGEDVLRSFGFRQSRVRHHGEVARIEIARDELEKVLTLDMFDRIAERFKALGFRFVTLDLEGYRTGALNEVLKQSELAENSKEQ
jgi:uncharacterized protein